MGCSASVASRQCVLPNKPLEDWSIQEVGVWFSHLPQGLQRYSKRLADDEGHIIMAWNDEFLRKAGITADIDRERLLRYRDRALLRKHTEDAAACASRASGPLFAAAAATVEAPAARGDAAEGHEGPPPQPSSVANGAVKVQRAPSTTITAHRVVHVQSRQAMVQPKALPAPPEPPEPVEPAAPATAHPGKGKLMVAVKLGIKAACGVLVAVGPSLPFPGAEAANLLLKVLEMADQALVNADNIAALRDRAAAFLDLLLEYADTLGTKGAYKRAVTQYRELLQDILAYAEEYRSRNVVLKLLLGGSDKGRHESLCADLGQLTESVMLTVGVDTNAQVAEAVVLLRRQAEYTDRSQQVAAQVAALGGVEAVAADESKLATVMQTMDSGQALTISTVAGLIRSAQAAGPHRHIRQPDLCLFWQANYGGEAEVPWAVFWQDFPALVESIGQPKLAALKQLLQEQDARARLQQQLERDGNPTRISVYDLRLAFRGDADVVDEVAAMLHAAIGAAAAATAAAATAAAAVVLASASASAAPPGVATGTQGGATATTSGCEGGEPAAASAKAAAAAPGRLPPGYRCQLPAVDPAYTGRGGESAGLVAELCRPGSRAVLLQADGGYGKSSLAIDVGMRLVGAGAAGGGALWADLREAGSVAEVAARVCAAVGAEKEEELPSKLRELTSRGPLLVVVDNAEDAVNAGKDCRAKLTSLLGQLFAAAASAAGGAPAAGAGAGTAASAAATTAAAAASVKLLVTSRPTAQPLSLPPDCPASLVTHVVSAMGAEEAGQLLSRTCQDLTPQEVADICAACACVPLLVRLAGEALAAGRTTVKELLAEAEAGPGAASAGSDSDGGGGAGGGGGGGGGGSRTSCQLALVLGCLARRHQQAMAQLCIFPSGFDEDAAGAVLAAPPRQALVTLQLLYRDGMLQYNSVRRQYVMHMAVREAAAALGARLQPEWARQAEERFAGHVAGLLCQWGEMYYSAQEWRLALAMARDHENDIIKLAKLAAGGNVTAAAALGGVACNAVNSLLDSMGLIKAMRPWLEGAAEALAPAPSVAASEGGGGDVQQPPQPAQPAAAAGVLLLLSWSLFQLRRHKEGEAAARRAQDIIAARCLTHLPSSAAPAAPPGGGSAAAQPPPPLQQRTSTTVVTAANGGHLEAWCLHFLAWNIQRQYTDVEGAEALHRRALELTTQLYGPHHPETLYSTNTVAANLNEQRRAEDAEPLFRGVLEARRRVLGEEHPNSVMSLVWLAFCINQQGRSGDAEPLYRQVVALQRRVLGRRHYDTLNSTALLRECLARQGKHEQMRRLEASDSDSDGEEEAEANGEGEEANGEGQGEGKEEEESAEEEDG